MLPSIKKKNRIFLSINPPPHQHVPPLQKDFYTASHISEIIYCSEYATRMFWAEYFILYLEVINSSYLEREPLRSCRVTP